MVLTPYLAKWLAGVKRIPLGLDFHTLDSDTLDRLAVAAKDCGYRKPKNGSGSTLRHFYSYLNKKASKA